MAPSADIPPHQRGLRRGFDTTPSCLICKWSVPQRRALISRYLEGASYRTLSGEFPASYTSIGTHLRSCVSGQVARQREHRHRALDWREILDGLAAASDTAAAAAVAGFERGDLEQAITGVSALTASVERRIAIADHVRKLEHRQLAEAVRELATTFTYHCPTTAPAVIAEIIADRPAATALLEDLAEAGSIRPKGADHAPPEHD